VTSPKVSERFATHGDGDLLSEVFHGISQPLTALECGLELSLRQDKDSAQLRAQVKAALESAQILHQRVVVLRMLLDAGDPGDTPGFFEVRFAVVLRPYPMQSKTTQAENARKSGFSNCTPNISGPRRRAGVETRHIGTD